MENLVKTVALIFLSSTISFAQTQWIEPTQEICEVYSGKKDSKYEPCLASWENANRICEAMNAKLPSLEELKDVVKQCNGKIGEHEKNASNKEYQLCFKKKGFEGSFFYWSSTKAPEQLGHMGIQFEQGFDGFANSFYGLHVKCKKVE